MALDQCIVEKCKTSWDEQFLRGLKNSGNCSGFLKSVAQKLGVPMANLPADGIIDSVATTWRKVDSGAEAVKLAATGYFVVVGLRAKDHTPPATQGHVAIVVTGPLYHGKYPVCWGGSTGHAQSKGDKSVGTIFPVSSRDKVSYFAYIKPVCTVAASAKK
jgi:hypothetical protein